MIYWGGGPGRHTSDWPFYAEVTDANGRTFWSPLHNGRDELGRSEGDRSVESEETLPAACDPLGPGTYTLRVVGKPRITIDGDRPLEIWPAMSAGPITLKVAENRDARLAAEKNLLARAATDSFAKYVTEVYSIDPIVKRWFDEVLVDHPKIVTEAIGRLDLVRRLPPDGDALLMQAAIKHCRRDREDGDWQLFLLIAGLGANVRTEEGLDSVLMVAESKGPGLAVTYAIGRLACFPQKRAEDALVVYAKDKDAAIRWYAIQALAQRRN